MVDQANDEGSVRAEALNKLSTLFDWVEVEADGSEPLQEIIDVAAELVRRHDQSRSAGGILDEQIQQSSFYPSASESGATQLLVTAVARLTNCDVVSQPHATSNELAFRGLAPDVGIAERLLKMILVLREKLTTNFLQTSPGSNQAALGASAADAERSFRTNVTVEVVSQLGHLAAKHEQEDTSGLLAAKRRRIALAATERTITSGPASNRFETFMQAAQELAGTKLGAERADAGQPRILPLEALAVLSHDFGQGTTLKSFAPIAFEDDLHWPEAMAIAAFGEFADNVRTPRCRYMSVWRDPQASLNRGEDKPSTQIIMAATFAEAAVEASADLNRVEDFAAQMMTGMLRLDLTVTVDRDIRVKAIELEVTDPILKKHACFRSCWKGEEMKGLDLMVQIDAPNSQEEPLRFHVAGRLPRRYNHGATVEEQMIAFSVSGGALPMPSWLNH